MVFIYSRVRAVSDQLRSMKDVKSCNSSTLIFLCICFQFVLLVQLERCKSACTKFSVVSGPNWASPWSPMIHFCTGMTAVSQTAYHSAPHVTTLISRAVAQLYIKYYNPQNIMRDLKRTNSWYKAHWCLCNQVSKPCGVSTATVSIIMLAYYHEG